MARRAESGPTILNTHKPSRRHVLTGTPVPEGTDGRRMRRYAPPVRDRVNHAEGADMNIPRGRHTPRRGAIAIATTVSTVLILGVRLYAQSPWERAASNLEASFTGPLARSLALVAIVLGGLMFMFGEGGAKRQISGIVFGGGLALFAAQFLAWLF
jgi:type IV secretory pathway VirB2 component (pilin)